MGFSINGNGPQRTPAFTLNSGPVGEVENDSAICAWDKFMNDSLIDHLLSTAIKYEHDKGSTIKPTYHSLLSYIAFYLASGIVQISRERLLFRKNDCHGLLKNEYLQSLLTRDELVQSKSLFIGERDAMTECFNSTSQKFYQPFRFPLIFASLLTTSKKKNNNEKK